MTHCKRITDLAVLAVTSKCPELTVLSLAYCDNISDAAVVAVASTCNQHLSLLNTGGVGIYVGKLVGCK